MDPQAQMNEAFKNYLALSSELLADGEYLLGLDGGNVHWQRNFVRTVASIIEGFSHCIRQIAAAGFEHGAKELDEGEKKVLFNEDKFSASERIKLTLKGAYRMFEIEPVPDFGTRDWIDARQGIDRRNSLMHPKTIADLEISPDSWGRIYSGFTWLFAQHANFIWLLCERHDK